MNRHYNPPPTYCNPSYNSDGTVRCGNQGIPGCLQYTLRPYNPYLSDIGEGCVTSTCSFTDQTKKTIAGKKSCCYR